MQTDTTRRAVLLAAPIAAVATALPAAAFATGPDAQLLDAWERRKAAYARYNELPFGDTPAMTPEEQACWDIIDAAELTIRSAVARTPRGVAIQIWTALSHEQSFKREDAHAVERGDLAHLLAHEETFDWDARVTLAALRSLEAMGA